MSPATALPPAERLRLDTLNRAQALRTDASFIVSAPAGSGKTELLTQRVLALLTQVDHPEEVVALTFTRKAAAEMRQRVLHSLSNAQTDPLPAAPHKQVTYGLARQVLAHDQARGWSLLTQPNRLRITTLDALCASLVGQMPILAQMGSQARISDTPDTLYQAAAQSLLDELEGDGPVAPALQVVLQHLDNDTGRLRQALIDMLGQRDQWLRDVQADPDWAGVRQALGQLIAQQLRSLAALLSPAWKDDFIAAIRPAVNHLLSTTGPDAALTEADRADLAHLAGLTAPYPLNLDTLPAWQALARLVLTGQGQVRATVASAWGLNGKAMASEKKALSDALKSSRGSTAEAALAQLRLLPAAWDDPQDQAVIQALTLVLKHAAAHLWLVFQRAGEVDFIEIAFRALKALGTCDEPSQLLLRLDYALRHLLIDEFQDTAPIQIELVQRLTAGWQEGDGRTLFLVGDPMQSIYRFRKADVSLFLRVRDQPILPVRLTALQLYLNNRSSQALVDWVNTAFASLFPPVDDPLRGGVHFEPAICPLGAATEGGVWFHPQVNDGKPAEADAGADADAPDAGDDDATEADQVVALIAAHRRANPEQTLAVLGRARTHLSAIARGLRQAVPPIAFQAVEVEALADSQVIQDLLSLTHALLHPGDRLHWLAVLRAPWCGLTLADLHALASQRAGAIEPLLADPAVLAELSDDGQRRAAHTNAVMQQALDHRGRLRLRRWIEGTWRALGGPAALDSAEDLAQARCFLDLIDALDDRGTLDLALLEHELDRLYVPPDAQATPHVQLMTLHKSKGLEFDVVIVPGTTRRTRSDTLPLIRWEHVSGASGPAIGVCASAQADAAPRASVLTYLQSLEADRAALEAQRLLYVAATRAKRELHFFGTVGVSPSSGALIVPPTSQFLGMLWPQAEPAYTAAWQARVHADVPQTDPGAAAAPNPAAAFAPLLVRLRAPWQLGLKGATVTAADTTSPAPPPNVGAPDRPGNATEPDDADPLAADIGTLVHQYLQAIATDGLRAWDADRLTRCRPGMARWLAAQGHAAPTAHQASAVVLQHLHTTLQSQAGRWILGLHPHSGCEVPLTSTAETRTRAHIIDRTFVSADGVRWIIDYKTAQVDATGQLSPQRWADYTAQLQRYRALFDPQETVRMGVFLTRTGTLVTLADDAANAAARTSAPSAGP